MVAVAVSEHMRLLRIAPPTLILLAVFLLVLVGCGKSKY